MKKESKEKRKKDIYEAATAEFLEKGYENASMENIARRCGLTKGGLYHHFGSKDEIFIEVNNQLSEPVIFMIYRALENSDAAEGLIRFIKEYLTFWIEHPRESSFLMLSIIKMLDNEKLVISYRSSYEDIIGFHQTMFQKGIDKKQFVAFDTRTAAISLQSALDGVIYYLLIEPSLKLDDVIGRFSDNFVNRFKR